MVALVLFLLGFATSVFSAVAPIPGYRLTEGKTYATLKFKLYKNLIIIPAKLNDTLDLDLILDSGTRSILLYGKKFKRMTNLLSEKTMRLSGWGSHETIEVKRSYPNTISIGEVHGDGLCAAIVDSRNLFTERVDIDGIIGYEIFARFAIEIDYKKKSIYLYDKITQCDTHDFMSLPMSVNLSRPEISSTILTQNKKTIQLNLLVDTGSSLGLTLFSKNIEELAPPSIEQQIGIGLAGPIHGYPLLIKSIRLGDHLMKGITSNFVHVKSHPDEDFKIAGSLGAGFLKNYQVIFDYPSSKLYLRKYSRPGSRR